MKKFLSSITNKIKSTYLTWVIIHFFIYVISGNFLIFNSRFMESRTAISYLFPDCEGQTKFDIEYYDYSDFLFYLIIPILLYFVYYYWKKPDIKIF